MKLTEAQHKMWELYIALLESQVMAAKAQYSVAKSGRYPLPQPDTSDLPPRLNPKDIQNVIRAAKVGRGFQKAAQMLQADRQRRQELWDEDILLDYAADYQ